jgi:hypothetical protein
MAFRAGGFLVAKDQRFKLMLTTFARVFENRHFRTPVVAVIQYKSLRPIFTADTRFNSSELLS